VIQTTVRKSAVAGFWYPGDPLQLVREVSEHLRAVQPFPFAIPGRVVGLICPHAGLKYSGPVAAHGFALLRNRPSATVVMVGPAHRSVFDGVAVYSRGAFETPLGRVPVAEDLADALIAADPRLYAEPRPHRDEHSLEMQLPFLQHTVADLRIVPMLMGSQSKAEVSALTGALSRVLPDRPDVLLLASSDLSHYHPAAVANRMDALVVGDVERFDPESLQERIERTHDHACGGGPMVAVMKAARALGAEQATVLRYADSGDEAERNKSRVVGYLSAVLTAPPPA
jgi:AmmeMemoRadiSam system protein B